MPKLNRQNKKRKNPRYFLDEMVEEGTRSNPVLKVINAHGQYKHCLAGAKTAAECRPKLKALFAILKAYSVPKVDAAAIVKASGPGSGKAIAAIMEKYRYNSPKVNR